jgi:iron complex outermembrane receptor protein
MRLKLLLQARQLAVTDFRVEPEFTAGATYILTSNGKHVVKAAVSRNLKLPCLNDLYWVPGGNPDLKPEISAGGEAGYSFTGTSKSGIRSSIDLYFHGSRVDNLIQWVPDNGSGIWSARNIKTATIAGLESRLGTEIPFEKGSLTAHLNYTLTRSVTTGSEMHDDISEGKQMIYIPLHDLNMNADTRWHFLTAGLSASYQTRRYTAADESEWLPAFFLADAWLGTVLRVQRAAVVLSLRVNNVAGSSYESVSNYPMPLRTFTLKMKINYSGKNNINTQPFREK